MYILVLSKIIVQEQKKGEQKFCIGQKDCSGFHIPYFAKKNQNELWPTQYKEIKWKFS